MKADCPFSDFSQFLQLLGDGALPTSGIRNDKIQLPNSIVWTRSAIDFVFPNINDIINREEITDRAILAPKNEDCVKLNSNIISLMAGEEKLYLSCGKIISDDLLEKNPYPTEYPNSLNISAGYHRIVWY